MNQALHGMSKRFAFWPQMREGGIKRMEIIARLEPN